MGARTRRGHLAVLRQDRHDGTAVPALRYCRQWSAGVGSSSGLALALRPSSDRASRSPAYSGVAPRSASGTARRGGRRVRGGDGAVRLTTCAQGRRTADSASRLVAQQPARRATPPRRGRAGTAELT